MAKPVQWSVYVRGSSRSAARALAGVERTRKDCISAFPSASRRQSETSVEMSPPLVRGILHMDLNSTLVSVQGTPTASMAISTNIVPGKISCPPILWSIMGLHVRSHTSTSCAPALTEPATGPARYPPAHFSRLWMGTCSCMRVLMYGCLGRSTGR